MAEKEEDEDEEEMWAILVDRWSSAVGPGTDGCDDDGDDGDDANADDGRPDADGSDTEPIGWEATAIPSNSADTQRVQFPLRRRIRWPDRLSTGPAGGRSDTTSRRRSTSSR